MKPENILPESCGKEAAAFIKTIEAQIPGCVLSDSDVAYNIWRYLKIMANESMKKDQTGMTNSRPNGLKGIMDNTLRIARLKLLYLAAKVVIDSNVDKVKYSIHDIRTPGMLHFLKFLDKARRKVRPWEEDSRWPHRFAVK